MNTNELADKIAIKELVDRISMLADKKDFEQQVQLFTADAISETIADGKTILKITGRKEMAAAFNQFLQQVETVYHFNGQHVITLNGNYAQGKLYCFITLISKEAGNKITTTIGATYEDEYVHINHQWLVAKRTGHFEWQKKNVDVDF
ncbi:SnoaL-like domain-containing protein [Chitinophaga jiangningensis]|uniref:SnoaL-like domain-containing protein n=1 Tax=Chitinophaga jiangningensis TaxID=1419482 RepID=A0A1M7KHM4_9BACT|nr:nuclear transport factor 2 family protein [Chitinophaga jiangningensis]SHM64855.1 SnoaL-like domain-containing protein [Chitinophaga jiangningensis]